MRKSHIIAISTWRVVFAAILFARVAFANETPKVAIIVPANSDALLQFAGSELQRYVKSLFKIEASLGDATASDGLVFRLAVSKEALSDQGFVLRPEGNVLDIIGGSPRAVLWAVYELVERWGVRYLIHSDVLPESPGALRIPETEIKFEPVMRTRAWRLVNDLAHGPISWTLEENKSFLHQIAKMKFNRVVLSFWPCQPFVDYTFQGMRKPPGQIYFGEHYPIDDDTVGRERLQGITEFTNPDFAGATSPDDLTKRAIALARGILTEAEKLGMETGLLIQPFEWPKEFIAVLPGSEPATQLGSVTAGPGKNQSTDDPLLREMVATIFHAYIETYTKVEFIYVTMPEHRSWTEQSQHAYEALDKSYGLQALGSYEDL